VGKTTADNPTAIVDRQTGAVHFLYQIDYARCYYVRSDDDGLSFTAPVDITATFEQFRKEYDWNVIAPGPGHGIQLKNGRLLVPVWLSTGGHKHRPSCQATIYSDDHGRTWSAVRLIEPTNDPSYRACR
jgi:sialidase-1